MKTQGLIHVYYGDGKGKTTAALGLALRAYGQGFFVIILQFFKGTFTGELASLEKLPGIQVLRSNSSGKFLSAMNAAEIEVLRNDHNRMLTQALQQIQQDRPVLLVLDEGMDAAGFSMLDIGMLRELLTHKPDGVEIVITGHQPVGWIVDSGDYVTEMVKRKHPYDLGTTARKGIEF